MPSTHTIIMHPKLQQRKTRFPRLMSLIRLFIHALMLLVGVVTGYSLSDIPQRVAEAFKHVQLEFDIPAASMDEIAAAAQDDVVRLIWYLERLKAVWEDVNDVVLTVVGERQHPAPIRGGDGQYPLPNHHTIRHHVEVACSHTMGAGMVA